MTDPVNPTVVDGHILVVAGVVAVSFQRYPEDALRSDADAPRSSGALPVKLSTRTQACLPALEGEGIWLGLSLQGSTPCRLQVGWLSAVASAEPPRWSWELTGHRQLVGLHDRDGTFRPFIRAPLSRNIVPCAGIIIVVEESESVEVQFVGASEFEARTGWSAPRPISPTDSYGGWRLPRLPLRSALVIG